jgi:hypothetical protein
VARRRTFGTSCIFALLAASLLLSACTHILPNARYVPSGAIRGKGTVSLGSFTYEPPAQVAQNQIEFHNPHKYIFDRPIPEVVKRGVTRELEAGGFTISTAGMRLDVTVQRCWLKKRAWNVELDLDTAWRLTSADRTVTREVRAQRRRALYTAVRQASDMNDLIGESFEEFFGAADVRAFLEARRETP